ncbi:TIGR02594 family protein [Reichenbachiella faecimaris]|uniref:TIGR02594 family protein n=1 Tax=Reichenbachiella faecimaris TaxID=692418 RepID=A0A1W2GQJ6_REIFA|nr:TIGR02594 family protein [Reichenbachiella faecimaris]SMD38834.1 TIGR02594 family protein [Reichenbachiella faecimaris]
MSKLLQVAFKELGQAEIPGSQHNPRIVAYAEQSNFPGIKDDETPWCSIFVNFCCDELNYQRSGKANARSWLQVGSEQHAPRPGDVVVFWRESIHSWKGHVAIYLGHSDDRKEVFCIGGNQGNAVSVAAYDAGKVLGYRRVGVEVQLDIPEPVLQKGDKGEEVISLQRLLNKLGYNCGDADGDFGNKTIKALKLLQANNQLTVDGVYGNQSKSILESLLQS